MSGLCEDKEKINLAGLFVYLSLSGRNHQGLSCLRVSRKGRRTDLWASEAGVALELRAAVGIPKTSPSPPGLLRWNTKREAGSANFNATSHACDSLPRRRLHKV